VHKKNTLKALTQILEIRGVQKELAEIDVFKANKEEAARLDERKAAEEQLKMRQGLWLEYMDQKDIIPELIAGLSRDVVVGDSALTDRNKQHGFAKNKSQIKVELWKLSEARVRQTQQLQKNVKREIFKRKEEENLRRTEERTSYNWGAYD